MLEDWLDKTAKILIRQQKFGKKMGNKMTNNLKQNCEPCLSHAYLIHPPLSVTFATNPDQPSLLSEAWTQQDFLMDPLTCRHCGF